MSTQVAQTRPERAAMAKRWYIVHAYTNFERKVADAIRERAKAAGLEDLFEEVLVPTEEVVEVKRGRKVQAERKFLPGCSLALSSPQLSCGCLQERSPSPRCGLRLAQLYAASSKRSCAQSCEERPPLPPRRLPFPFLWRVRCSLSRAQ